MTDNVVLPANYNNDVILPKNFNDDVILPANYNDDVGNALLHSLSLEYDHLTNQC